MIRLVLCSGFLAGAGGGFAAEVEDDPRVANFVLNPRQAKISQNAVPPSAGKSPVAARPATDAPRGQIQVTQPGPWGEIEFFTTYLEVPLDLLKTIELSSYSLDWKFVGIPDADLEKLFRSVELPAAISAQLLDSGKWRRDEGTTTVPMSAETIVALPSAARGTIYAVLARFTANRYHYEPLLVPGGDVRTWLRTATLRPEILETIEKTLHRRGQTTLFSDKALVLRMAESDAERLLIRKALSRTATLIGKLRLGPQADAAKLADYWSAGRRFKDTETFLESMIATDGVERIDLVHLLPANVRRLLYTFPNETHGLYGYYPDCHWTSLNFFNYEPLERLAEPPLATAYTLENFVEVPKAERLGDVLFFMNRKTGDTYHSCVYIADDIVFTKNGRSRLSPWLLMRLGEVREIYGIYQQSDVVCYRRRSLN